MYGNKSKNLEKYQSQKYHIMPLRRKSDNFRNIEGIT